MKQTLKVKPNSEKEYLIEISDNSFAQLNQDLYEYTRNQKRLIVISQKVYHIYKKALSFSKSELYILKDGEKEKNINNYFKIIQHAIKIGLTRSDVIIAIGGGVVGDIAGFVASTYMRGIDFIQIPTTLLACVDSSVGGKTAIDLREAKNIIGSFYQPKRVFININFLKTLDKKQFMSGLGEVLKYAFIEDSCGYDEPLFLYEFLTLNYQKIWSQEAITTIRLIEYCLKLKSAVVNQDEKESGLRKILNLGHTIAHSLETITKYRKYTHGEAVVYGMYIIFDWALEKGYISKVYHRLSTELLGKYGFKRQKFNYSIEKLVEIMKKDKKATSDKITFIVPCDKKTVKEIKILPLEATYMFD